MILGKRGLKTSLSKKRGGGRKYSPGGSIKRIGKEPGDMQGLNGDGGTVRSKGALSRPSRLSLTREKFVSKKR